LWLLAALLVLEMQAISIQQVAVDPNMQQAGNEFQCIDILVQSSCMQQLKSTFIRQNSTQAIEI
jgi:N-acetylglutamate synthase-like GNAT family acetyltransferase